MNNLMTFDFEGNDVRLQDVEGSPWFVGKDICQCLGINNHRQAITRLDDDEKDCVTISDAIGRDRLTTIISEPGAFKLAFTSRTKAAKRFKRWLAHEVLPSIRRTGGYQLPGVPETTRQNWPYSASELRTFTPLLRAANDFYGVAAARKLWKDLGLPDLTTVGEIAGTPADDSEGCLRHFLRFTVSRRQTMGEYIDRALACDATQGQLADLGIYVCPSRYPGYVAIANRSPFLEQVFLMTQWNAAWNLALVGVSGGRVARNEVNFGGKKRRCVLVPLNAVNAVRVA